MSNLRVVSAARMIATIGICAVIGCGSSEPVGTIHGTLTFDEKPVADARIQLRSPETGHAATVVTNSEGKFRLEQPMPAGNYVVNVVPDYDPPVAGESDNPPPPPERPDIPDKYRDPTTSGLTIDVAEGDNAQDLKMASK